MTYTRLLAHSSNSAKYIWMGIVLATLYWFIESAIHTFAFGYGSYFSQLLTSDVHELWKRLFVAALLVAFGLFAQRGINVIRRTDTALKTSEKKYRTLFEEAMNPVFVLDETGRFTAWNQATLDFFEVDSEMLSSNYYQDVTLPALQEADPSMVVSDASPRSVEVDAEVGTCCKTLLLNLVPVQVEDRSTLYFGIGLDITQRKLAESDLRLAHAELNQIFETASCAMRLVDNQFDILKVNETFAEMSGVKAQRAVGAKCYEVFGGEHCHTESCPLTRVLAGEHEIELEVTKRRCNGTTVPCLLSARPFLTPDGTPLGIVESFNDITELKFIQEELRTERDRLRHILFQQFEGVGIVRPDFTLEYQNSTLRDQIGDFQGQPCYLGLLGRTAPCSDCLMQEALSSGRPQQREFRTAEQRIYEHTYTPFRDGSGEHRVLVLMRDISDRKASRAALIRSEQMAAIGELAAGVAHEINNPINGVLNYAEMLMDDDLVPARTSKIAASIISESERIARIVQSLLAFSRRESQYRIAVDAGDLLRDTLTIINAQMRRNFIKVEMEIADALPPIVCVPQEIQQVFLNVLNNARDALNQKYPESHQDKLLEVRAAVEHANHETFVVVSFHDQGTGIPGELLEKVVSPFFSTKPRGHGTGLGLSISQHIVNGHGGRLVIDSRAGEYTTVSVRLPVAMPDWRGESDGQSAHPCS